MGLPQSPIVPLDVNEWLDKVDSMTPEERSKIDIVRMSEVFPEIDLGAFGKRFNMPVGETETATPPGFLENLKTNAKDVAKGIVTGIPQIIAAGVGSVADPGRMKEQAYNERTGSSEYAPHLGDVGEGIKQHFGEYLEDPIGKAKREPVSTALDVFGLLAGAAGMLGKTGEIGQTGRLSNISRAAAAESKVVNKVAGFADEFIKANQVRPFKPEAPLKSASVYPESYSSKLGLAEELSMAEKSSQPLRKIAPENTFMPSKSIEEVGQARIQARQLISKNVQSVEKQISGLRERLTKNITKEEARVTRSKIKKLEAKLDTIDPAGMYRKINSEFGGSTLTQEDISRLGAKMSEYNYWVKGVDWIANKIKTSPLYNTIGDKVGALIPEKVKTAFGEHYGVPKEYIDMARTNTIRSGIAAEDGIVWSKFGQKTTSDVGKRSILEGVTAQSRTGVEDLKGTPFYDDAKYIQGNLNKLWTEAKELGLSESDFHTNRYLPYLNPRTMASELQRFRRELSSTGRLKRRGAKPKTITRKYWERNKAKLEKERWEIVDDKGGDKIKVRQFVPYGKIQDPYVLFAKGYSDLQHDLGIARIIKAVTENPEWSSVDEINDFVKFGDKYHLDPKFAKVGGIKNMYVHPHIARELSGMILQKGEVRKAFDTAISTWKSFKTILNPATHVRNVVSNAVLADLGGLSPWRRWDIYATAIGEIKNKGKYFREARAGGLTGNTFYQKEIADMLDMAAESKGFNGYLAKTIKMATERPGALYQAEEQFFKLAKFIHNRQRGLSVAESVADAEKWLFDYSTVSPAVGLMRRTVAPFITFQAKALPRVLETAIKHPLRLGKYYAAYKAVEEYSKISLGLSDEEYENLRRNSPDYIRKGGMWVLLPWRDRNNNYQFMNLSYFAPWGDWMSGGGSSGVGYDWLPGPIEQIVIPSNPIVRIPFELATNKSFFTGRDIVKPEDNTALAVGKYIGDTFLPPLLGYSGRKIIEKGIMNKPNYFGEQENPVRAFASSLGGVSINSVNTERERKFNTIKYRKSITELNKRILSVRSNQALSHEAKLIKIGRIQRKINELKEEYEKNR